MGNCICNSAKALDSPEKRYAGIEQQPLPQQTAPIKLIDPFEQHHTDTTESTIEVSLATAPITPSTAASSQWSASPDAALVPMSKIQKGRALAARLEKAQRMQRALESNETTTEWPLLPPSRAAAVDSVETVNADGPVTCCAYDSENALYVATARGTVTRDGEVLVQQGATIRSMAVQGSTLVTGGDDQTCHVYEEDAEWSVQRLDRVYAVDVQGEIVAAGGWDGAVEILQHQNVVHRISREGLVLAVQFGAPGQLAVGGSDKQCGVYKQQEGEGWELEYEISRPSTIHALSWAKGNELLAIASKESVAITEKGKVLHELEARRNTDIAWSPSGSHLCVCLEYVVDIFETDNYQSIRKIEIAAATASWGQERLALGRENNTVSIVMTDWEQGELMQALSGSSSYFSNSAQGDWVLKNDVDLFHDLAPETNVVSEPVLSKTATVLNEPAAKILAMAFSEGSKYRPSTYFCTSANNGMVTVRNCSSWKSVAEIQFPALVQTIAFSNGSRYLALGCEDANVYISDSTSNWELVAKIEFADAISSLCFSGKNNERLAVGSVDGTMAFLTPHDAFDFAGEIEGFETVGVTAVDWSSKNLAVGRVDGSVAVYDTANIVKDFYDAIVDLNRDAAVVDVSFGVSSRFLAVGDEEGLIGIYSSKGGWTLTHEIQASACLSKLQWCPLGRHLAFGDIYGSIKVMDTIFWNEIPEATKSIADGYKKIESALSFSQDGKLVAYGGEDWGFGVMDSSENWALTVKQVPNENDESSGSNAPHEV